MMTGSKFVITPRITVGQLLMNFSQGTTLVMYVMFEMAPTTATGIDQKVIVATTAAMVRIFRMVRVFQVMLRLDHTTSPGTKPISRLDM
jgi:hypothetical protein